MTDIRVSTRIDLSEIWDEITDDQLRSEMDSRCIAAARTVEEAQTDSLTPLVIEALDLLRSGRADDAALSLERALFPKWKTSEDAFRELQKRRSA